MMYLKIKARKTCLLIIAGLALLSAMAGFGASDARANDPVALVEKFHGTLLQVMKSAPSTTARERYERLKPAIEEAFNLEFMIQLASGSQWRKFSQEDRSVLASAFSRMSIGTYAFRFDGYSGQTFKTIRSKDGPRETILVFTKLLDPDGEGVDLTYVTKAFGDQWRVIDVILAGGISEIALRHSEYRQILRSQGARALASILERKASELIE